MADLQNSRNQRLGLESRNYSEVKQLDSSKGVEISVVENCVSHLLNIYGTLKEREAKLGGCMKMK